MTKKLNDVFLQSLDIGDIVIVCGRTYDSIGEVARITNTQILLASGKRFSKHTGMQIGGESVWYKKYLSKATPDKIKRIQYEVKHRTLSFKLRVTRWDEYPLDILEKIQFILYEFEQNGEKT